MTISLIFPEPTQFPQFGFVAVAFKSEFTSTRKRSGGVSGALSVIGEAVCYSGGTEGSVGTLVTVGEG